MAKNVKKAATQDQILEQGVKSGVAIFVDSLDKRLAELIQRLEEIDKDELAESLALRKLQELDLKVTKIEERINSIFSLVDSGKIMLEPDAPRTACWAPYAFEPTFYTPTACGTFRFCGQPDVMIPPAYKDLESLAPDYSGAGGYGQFKSCTMHDRIGGGSGCGVRSCTMHDRTGGGSGCGAKSCTMHDRIGGGSGCAVKSCTMHDRIGGGSGCGARSCTMHDRIGGGSGCAVKSCTMHDRIGGGSGCGARSCTMHDRTGGGGGSGYGQPMSCYMPDSFDDDPDYD